MAESASDTVVDDPRDGADDLAAAWIGRVLEGRYRVDSVLGAGGFAVVFRARHLALGRDVAVKMLQPQQGDQTVLARFHREADVLARLQHPGIVAATDYGVSGATPFLVMELVEGRTLRDVIDEARPPIEHTLAITRQMLRALAYAHAQGVLHRDLKPGNVVLSTPNVMAGEDADPIVKVLDFGLAKLARGAARAEASITADGVAFGTPGYVSPEVLLGRPADARSDLYAVGVMLFEMLVGHRPHGTLSRGEELRATVTAAAPSLAEVAPGLRCGAELDAVLQLALARDPAERFSDAASMLAALEQIDPERRTAPSVQRARAGKTAGSSAVAASWRQAQVPLPILLVAVAVPTVLAAFLAVALVAVLLVD